MKLYEAPRYTRVRVTETGAIYYFERIDGMYSLCLNEQGEMVHLAAWTEVEVLPNIH